MTVIRKPIKNKKGLSQVIAVIIFILLVTISAGIIWASVKSLTTTLSPEFDCTKAKIEQPLKINKACYNTEGPETSDVKLTLERTFSNIEINRLDFTITFENQDSLNFFCGANCDAAAILKQGETENYYFEVGDNAGLQNVVVGVNECILASKEIEIGC
jgi:hypothetical protein